MTPLPLTATLLDYEAQVADLHDATDAQAALAHAYDFANWDALATFVDRLARRDDAVWPFERAVDAVVNGDLATLQQLLAERPSLVSERSCRVTHFDPPVHAATLLHYVAANGTEGYRQRTPPNAVAIAKTLLEAGANPNALAHLYGGECTTMALLMSSCHPAQAGVQVALVDLLIEHGASVENKGEGHWTSPLETALIFGYRDAAEALERHGAKLTLAGAAGLGRVAAVEQLLPGADASTRHRALAIAAQNGQCETTRALLDAGEDPNRFNPPGTHAHSTPLHQAALAGHLAVVQLLVERGARLDVEDTIYQGTPLGWAFRGEQTEVTAWLEAQGAR